MIDEHTIIRRDPEQEFSKIDDEIVMLSLNNAEYYTLNEVASTIWQYIEQPILVSDLLKKLQDKYDVDENTCKTDTFACLNELEMRSLVRTENDREGN